MAAEQTTQNDTTPWADLCKLADLPANGGGLYVVHNERPLAVFRIAPDQVRVVSDTCPHAGGSIASGVVDGDRVFCPWHFWPFNIHTGVCPDNASIKIDAFPARIEGEVVQIQVAGQKAEA